MSCGTDQLKQKERRCRNHNILFPDKNLQTQLHSTVGHIVRVVSFVIRDVIIISFDSTVM